MATTKRIPFNSQEATEYSRFVAEFVDAAKRFSKLDKWKNELPAVATHWILSAGEESRFLGKAFQSACDVTRLFQTS